VIARRRDTFKLQNMVWLLEQELELEPVFIGRSPAINGANQHRHQVQGVLAQECSENEPGEATDRCANGKGDWSVLDHAFTPPQIANPVSPVAHCSRL